MPWKDTGFPSSISSPKEKKDSSSRGLRAKLLLYGANQHRTERLATDSKSASQTYQRLLKSRPVTGRQVVDLASDQEFRLQGDQNEKVNNTLYTVNSRTPVSGTLAT